MARKQSGVVSAADVADIRLFVVDAMGKWRNVVTTVPPKAHAIEDHLCDQMLEAAKRQADWEFVAKLPQGLKVKDEIRHKTKKEK